MTLSLVVSAAACKPPNAGPPAAPSLPVVEVNFSPKGGCTESVVDALNRAGATVLVQAYSFTSAPIAKALVDAHKRGVGVKVLLDKEPADREVLVRRFRGARRDPTNSIDARHRAIAHNKIMVIDGGTVITGSFNFTKAAEENNAENLLVIQMRRSRGNTPTTGRSTRSIRSLTAGRGARPDAPLFGAPAKDGAERK